jgi:hypothetical protein
MSISALPGTLPRYQVVQTPLTKFADEEAKALPAKVWEAQTGRDSVVKIGILV